jgi:serine/threonine protein kinase
MQVAFGLIAGFFGLLLLAILMTLVLVPIFRAVGWCVRHVFAFIGGEIKDTLRLVGSVITGVIFSLLVVANILIFRWSASAHFGRAFTAEIGAGAASIYRILVGHPARLLGLKSLVDGLEHRVPDAVAAAPTADKPSRRTGQFENYRIIGSLAGGGSGGKLYIAEPDQLKLAAFARGGQHDVQQVVIKSFSLRDGSSLPQIVRESRALDAAKKLGLVLDHELSPERFFYVMRYVPGESLGLVTQHLHAASPEGGLSHGQLAKALGYMEHLLATLSRYHEGGLWHKDVKPDNIIIHGQEAHLVDFGLITPLRSAMTLTTHGTEYFRDPEMVRMALKGVKVHEVDGARFDVYAAGAVLYSVVENSFPAHGGLSQLTKRCPDALRWIIRRAMTDYDKRYPTAAAMLADLGFLRRAADPFAVKPAELPSMSGREETPAEPVVEVAREEFSFIPPRPFEAGARSPLRPAAVAAAVAAPLAERARPRLRVTNWWSGRYALDEEVLREVAGGLAPSAQRRAGSARPVGRPAAPRSAAEQVRSARARAEARRLRARQRMVNHRYDKRSGRRHASGVNVGVVLSVFIFLAFCVGLAGLFITQEMKRHSRWEREFAFAEAGAPVPTVPGAVAVADVEDVDSADFLPEMVPLSGAVLVVNDLQTPLDPTVQAHLTGAVAAMRQAGLEVLGILPGLALDHEALESTVEMIAELQMLRGDRLLDDGDVDDELCDWLDDRDEADVLIWIEPAGEESEPNVRVFASPDAREGAPPGALSSIQSLFDLRG